MNGSVAMTIAIIGLDLAKSVFQAHGVDESGGLPPSGGLRFQGSRPKGLGDRFGVAERAVFGAPPF
jgi:hypothetical protein